MRRMNGADVAAKALIAVHREHVMFRPCISCVLQDGQGGRDGKGAH